MAATAFLLAAGLGTRLRPLTLSRPKPLCPVGGVAMLDHAAALLQRHGHREVVVNAFHLAEQVEAWADKHPLRPRVSVEGPAILGTGGGLLKARPWLAEDFTIVNGDVLADADLGDLVLQDGVDGVMALRAPAGPYGVVAADAAGRVVDLVGLAKAEPEGVVHRDTHFTGIHRLRSAVLDLLPEGESCIIRQGYAKLVPQRRVGAVRHHGSWFDVGTLESYLEANLEVVDGRLELPVDVFARAARSHRDGVARPGWTGPYLVGEGAEIAPDAVLGGRVIIGEGARIGSGARLRDTVVWDGAVVPSDAVLDGCIVYDQGIVTLRSQGRAG